jgi:DNA-binding transcriptional MerR regulator
MTIGALSKRTGVPVKQLRRYENLGFLYTVGRTAGNYRLFDETARWCVEAVTTLRSLGLTLTEIAELIEAYLTRPDGNVGPLLASDSPRCGSGPRPGSGSCSSSASASTGSRRPSATCSPAGRASGAATLGLAARDPDA